MKRTENKVVTLANDKWTAVIKEGRAGIFYENERLFFISPGGTDIPKLIELLKATLDEGI